MFDQLTVISAALTGKLREAPTLRKWFWVFLGAIVFALLVLSYNSFMSLNFYQEMLERFTSWDNSFLPITVTVIIAILAYFLISSVTATLLDYIAGRKYKTDGHEPMFYAAIIGLVALLALDIYANLQGVDFVAFETTEEVMDNPLDNISASFDARRTSIHEQFKPRISDLENKIARIRDMKKAAKAGHNQVCKSQCPYQLGTGAVHWDGAITKYGHRLIKQLETQKTAIASSYQGELSSIRETETDQRETAKDDYSRDKARYDLNVHTKQSGHRKLVYFAYALAFLLTIIINHYSDQAILAIYPNREAELIAAYETKADRVSAMTAAQKAKYQFGNEQTTQMLQQLLSLLNEKDHPPLPYRESNIGFQSPDKSGGQSRVPKKNRGHESPGKMGEKSQSRGVKVDRMYQTEIDVSKDHPKFSTFLQPDVYRGIDEKKYLQFIKIAQQVKANYGRYVKWRIADLTSFSKNTVTKYMKVALEREDLEVGA